MKIVSMVLIIVGALMLAYQGITYNTQKTVAVVGPLRLESNEKKTIPLPPLIGAVTLAGGIVILFADLRKGHR